MVRNTIRCLITGVLDADIHHVKTRGSGGGDKAWNLMPLCREAHTEVHKIGLRRFSEKYPIAKDWLINNGWTICELRNKWIPPDH